MYITGYHGTNKVSADIILSSEFKISSSNKEWLGQGIYFYDKYEDALVWNRDSGDFAEAILHSIVCVEKEEFIDFDTDDGQEIWRAMKSRLTIDFPDSMRKSTQAAQCYTCNKIWELCKNVKVMAASFPSVPNDYNTLIDGRIKRREFCVRNNDVIMGTQSIDVILPDVAVKE